jgi:hypothetical protein
LPRIGIFGCLENREIGHYYIFEKTADFKVYEANGIFWDTINLMRFFKIYSVKEKFNAGKVFLPKLV